MNLTSFSAHSSAERIKHRLELDLNAKLLCWHKTRNKIEFFVISCHWLQSTFHYGSKVRNAMLRDIKQVAHFSPPGNCCCRKVFHYHDCASCRLLRSRQSLWYCLNEAAIRAVFPIKFGVGSDMSRKFESLVLGVSKKSAAPRLSDLVTSSQPASLQSLYTNRICTTPGRLSKVYRI